MVHLFKVPLQHADMFIRAINLKDSTITYQMLDKITAAPLEPLKNDKFIVNKGQILFDKNRFIDLQYAQLIDQTLN